MRDRLDIADEPARSVMHRIRGGETRRRLESVARQLVVEKYDTHWSTVCGGHTPDVRLTA